MANSAVSAKAIGQNILERYASVVGFTTTYHVSTTLDKQGRSRRVDISCVQAGQPRASGKIANPSVSAICIGLIPSIYDGNLALIMGDVNAL